MIKTGYTEKKLFLEKLIISLKFTALGFKTGDTVGIDINAEGYPIVYRH